MKNMMLKPSALLAAAFAAAAALPSAVAADRPMPGYLKKAVVYQMVLRNLTAEGTFRAAEKKLEHVRDIGADVVYLTPFVEMDTDADTSGWSTRQKSSGCNSPRNPYQIANYNKIDPEYGGDADFDSFCAQAHALGLKVYLDLVYCHCGPNNVIKDAVPDALQRNPDGTVKKNNYNFPLVNFESKDARKYLVDSMKNWIRRGADGFRCDIGYKVPLGFWEEAARECRAVKPDLVMINEGYPTEYLKTTFDSCYNFPWSFTIRRMLVPGTPGGKSPKKGTFAEKMEVVRKYEATAPENSLFLCFMDNHDTAMSDKERRFDRLKPVEAGNAGFVLTFLRRGLPLVFNGNEIADDALSSIFTPDDRSKPRKTVNWKRAETEAGKKRLALIRSLAKLRHEMPVFADGTQEWVTDGESQGAVAFVRRLDGCAVFVAANLTDKSVRFSPSCGFRADAGGAALLSEDGAVSESGECSLGPWGYVVAKGATSAATSCAGVSEQGMFPFVISYDSPDNVANMSHLLDAPAGKNGRIRVEDGHFADGKGRVRLNATNLTGPANFPTHGEADRLAARLARFGINCVRLHYFDSSYGTFMLPAEQGILDESGETRRKFDPERRDRMDYLVAQFKKRGIYVNVNLHVARTLGPADGIPPGAKNKNKGFNLFYPPLIALQREYAKELLSHVNPYTGMSYLKDPVVAVVELNNEEALWRKYLSGGLDDRKDAYGKYFKKLWSGWLAKKYGTTEKVRVAWNLAAHPFPYLDKFRIENGDYPLVHSKKSRAPMAMKRDFYRFVTDVEHDYWTGMRNYLKNDLGLEAPVAATQLRYSTPFLQAEMDYVDIHAYWGHPSVNAKWMICNDAMVNDAAKCIRNLASQRVLGKPYTVSEYNHPYPNFYGAEGQPMLRAYGALHGWDGVFEYSYNNRQNAEPDHNEYFFSMAARTDVLAHMPACAAMYLRGDVKESASTYIANLPYEEYFDRFVKKGTIAQGVASATDGKVPQELCLVRGTAVDLAAKSPAAECEFPKEGQKTFASDTGEIVLDGEIHGAGAWTVNTANTKVFSGFPNGRTFDLGGVKIAVGETKLGWATISLVSHDATGFGGDGRAAKILLTATGLCHNKGAKFTFDGNKISCRGADWGGGPTVAEGVNATIALPSKAARTKCWALDERGERKAEVPVAAAPDGCASVAIGPEYKTVWYEIAVD